MLISLINQQKRKFINSRGQLITLKFGSGTYIDPEVIIDQPENISIGKNTYINKGVKLSSKNGDISIGDNCFIDCYSVFNADGDIFIGDWSTISAHCYLESGSFAFDRFDLPLRKQTISGKGIYLMGDNRLGPNVVICDDVTLGRGAIIEAGSVVKGSIPMACLGAGNPAKILAKRFKDNWDFSKEERFIPSKSVPKTIWQHVEKRGRLITGFINKGEQVLDVGCGEGFISKLFLKKTNQVTGCDYSSEVIRKASRLYPQIKFLCCNSTNLKFSNNQFDKVILSDVAEHLLKVQLLKTLKEVKRVLKKGGSLVLATPISGSKSNTSTYSHIYEYSEKELRSILKTYFQKVDLIDTYFGLFIAYD